MSAFVWFWVVVVLLILLGMIFWAMFARGVVPKKKVDKLDDVLFRPKD